MGYDHDNPAMISLVEYSTTGIRLTFKSKKIHDVVNEFKHNLCKNLWDRFEYVNSKPNLLIATFLDPRYRELVIEHFMGPSAVDQAIEFTKTEALKEVIGEKEDQGLVDEPETSKKVSVFQTNLNLRFRCILG